MHAGQVDVMAAGDLLGLDGHLLDTMAHLDRFIAAGREHLSIATEP